MGFGRNGIVEKSERGLGFEVFFADVNPVKNHAKSTHVDKKSSISVCCLMHLPSACRLFVYEYRLEFWWKSIDFGIVFVAFTFGVLIFSYQKVRQLYVRIPESQIEVPKILKSEGNNQN